MLRVEHWMRQSRSFFPLAPDVSFDWTLDDR
jgi:hypothetical protein